MNNLITREELLIKIVEANPLGGMIGCKFIEDLIKNQPTAYDVGKVVEMLEYFKHVYCRSDDELELIEDVLNDAIKTVKGGGVDE